MPDGVFVRCGLDDALMKMPFGLPTGEGQEFVGRGKPVEAQPLVSGELETLGLGGRANVDRRRESPGMEGHEVVFESAIPAPRQVGRGVFLENAGDPSSRIEDGVVADNGSIDSDKSHGGE